MATLLPAPLLTPRDGRQPCGRPSPLPSTGREGQRELTVEEVGLPVRLGPGFLATGDDYWHTLAVAVSISTYDTDYLLIEEGRLEEALHHLHQAGHAIPASPQPRER